MDCCPKSLLGQPRDAMKVDLEQQLSQLPNLSRPALHEQWHALFGSQPHPKLRREILIPILAYRLQEKALGGLKPSTARRLRAVAEEIGGGKKIASNRSSGPRPGTRMVRQWQGKLHEVIVLESGFTYDGKKYKSLSEIARAITGTRWSGPAFFGLKKQKAEVAA